MEYNDFIKTYENAEILASDSHKQNTMKKVVEKLETDMEFLGVVGVEDTLQTNLI